MCLYSIVTPAKLIWKSSYELVNESYVSCSATGYPAPCVFAEVHHAQNCSINYTNNYIKVDNYTGKALITFTRSGAFINCLSIRINCYSVDIQVMQMFNITSKYTYSYN